MAKNKRTLKVNSVPVVFEYEILDFAELFTDFSYDDGQRVKYMLLDYARWGKEPDFSNEFSNAWKIAYHKGKKIIDYLREKNL